MTQAGARNAVSLEFSPLPAGTVASSTCADVTSNGRSGAIPGSVQVTIIHEMLHSLGLGENPPSPQEISFRILKLCA